MTPEKFELMSKLNTIVDREPLTYPSETRNFPHSSPVFRSRTSSRQLELFFNINFSHKIDTFLAQIQLELIDVSLIFELLTIFVLTSVNKFTIFTLFTDLVHFSIEPAILKNSIRKICPKSVRFKKFRKKKFSPPSEKRKRDFFFTSLSTTTGWLNINFN